MARLSLHEILGHVTDISMAGGCASVALNAFWMTTTAATLGVGAGSYTLLEMDSSKQLKWALHCCFLSLARDDDAQLFCIG